MTPTILVIGLGNPGSSYSRNRHNVGFMCVDRLAQDRSASFGARGRGVKTASVTLDGNLMVLAKPSTFMNTSGPAVRRLMAAHGLQPSQLLIVCDDLDLPLGRLRLRRAGSAGGHHGLKSIIANLQTSDFPRLRIGVGRPESREEVIDYVLHDFSAGERPLVDRVLGEAARAVESVVLEGLEAAMNRWNQVRICP